MTETPVIERFFVCIGAQKAGTTWLARVLAQHPEIFMTPVKEIHYFDHLAGITEHLNDRKRRSRMRKYHQRRLTQWHRLSEFGAQRDWYRDYMKSPIGDDWYRALFSHRGGRPFAGEATPEYALIGRGGFSHLKALAPNARLLYILRNPVERAWSQVLHRARKERFDASVLSANRLIALTRSADFSAHGDYGAVLAALDSVFSRDQIAVEFYEDIHEDRQAALKRICRFIGIGFEETPSSGLERRYNPSQSDPISLEFRGHLQREYADAAKQVEARLGRLPKSWRDEFPA